MLQLRIHGIPPYRLHSEPIYGIVSRNTIFGLHKTGSMSHMDKDCTKSALWFSSNKTIAENMIQRLRNDLRHGEILRHLDANRIVRSEKIGSLLPLNLEEFKLDDLEKICILHHFDMYIAHTVHHHNDLDIMECYEFITHEHPNRAIVERYMRDMLYKNN